MIDAAIPSRLLRFRYAEVVRAEWRIEDWASTILRSDKGEWRLSILPSGD